MREFDRVRNDLAIANRIVAHEDAVDAYGHVSMRNPQNPNHFFMARRRSNEGGNSCDSREQYDEALNRGIIGGPSRQMARGGALRIRRVDSG